MRLPRVHVSFPKEKGLESSMDGRRGGMRQLLGGRGGGRRLVRDGWSESNGHQRDCARGRGKLERDTRVMQSRGEEERKLSLAAESNRCQLGEMREERGEDDERRAGKEGGRTLLIG